MSGKQRQEATVAVPAKDEKDKDKEKKEGENAKSVDKPMPDNVKDPGGADLVWIQWMQWI